MNPFRVRQPRRFHHPLIYSDERQERLRDIERRARRELGLPVSDGYRPDNLRGAFSRPSSRKGRHVGRGRASRRHVPASVLLLLIVALLLLARYLMSGRWLF